jgi:uncharacterized protein
MEPTENIKIIKDKVIEILNRKGIITKNIILFGSRARGESSKYSDYDFLIIIDKTLKIKEKMELFDDLISQLSEFPIDIIIKSEKELEDFKNQIGTVTREAIKEGIII